MEKFINMEEEIIFEEGEEQVQEEVTWLTEIDYLTAACLALDSIEMHSPMTKSGQARQASAKRKCINIIYHCIDNLYNQFFSKDVEED
jgi:hypothetical protein